MSDQRDRIDQLQQRIELLLSRQNDFLREINQLRVEVFRLQSELRADAPSADSAVVKVPVEQQITVEPPKPVTSNVKSTPAEPLRTETFIPKSIPKPPKPKKSSIEKFIGENLFNKIGILVTIIGVAIGAKYSIENNLISPLTRIILGYLTGLILLGVGIKLKTKYANYSAVLVSGAMTVMYFITYAAYDYYDLLPQLVAFGMMSLFTVFTVIAALHYDKQVIAHIGLVGAYAVPFLLSDGSGNVLFLLSYVSIINLGILFIGFKRYWKALNYVAFGLTYLIFVSWFAISYSEEEHFALALFFLSVFFITFYAATLAYKILKADKFGWPDVLLLFLNSLAFYAFGYFVLDSNDIGAQLLGVFTLFNAALHFGVAQIILKQNNYDKSLFYFVVGLVLAFVTMAIPVQLDGNWVTLGWSIMAVLLFWIGNKSGITFYKSLSYLLVLLAFISLIQDWEVSYFSYILEEPETRIIPIFNIYFLTSMLASAAFGFIIYHRKIQSTKEDINSIDALDTLITVFLSLVFLVSFYYGIRIEIENYWQQLYIDSTVFLPERTNYYYDDDYVRNNDLTSYKHISVIIYSMIFVCIGSLISLKWLNNKVVRNSSFVLLLIILLSFLSVGLYELSELRESYLDDADNTYYSSGIFNIIIRYIALGFAGLGLWVLIRFREGLLFSKSFKRPIDIIFAMILLWILSSELIHWMDIAGSNQSYKFGLSILWGVYAVLTVGLGIWKRMIHLRITAMILFGATLVKLFLYDLTNFDTISKTIVFVSLGVLLLVFSFLYNKYKNIISDETNS